MSASVGSNYPRDRYPRVVCRHDGTVLEQGQSYEGDRRGYGERPYVSEGEAHNACQPQ